MNKNITPKRTNVQFRQGDLLITRIEKLPARNTLKQVKPKRGSVILAEGELTNHSHKIAAVAATLLHNGEGERFLKIHRATRLVHEEHDPINLRVGWYAVTRQREYHPLGNHFVGD